MEMVVRLYLFLRNHDEENHLYMSSGDNCFPQIFSVGVWLAPCMWNSRIKVLTTYTFPRVIDHEVQSLITSHKRKKGVCFEEAHVQKCFCYVGKLQIFE